MYIIPRSRMRGVLPPNLAVLSRRGHIMNFNLTILTPGKSLHGLDRDGGTEEKYENYQ
jgi:hypothetical protein